MVRIARLELANLVLVRDLFSQLNYIRISHPHRIRLTLTGNLSFGRLAGAIASLGYKSYINATLCHWMLPHKIITPFVDGKHQQPLGV